MKLTAAIPYADGQVFGHFGRTEYFLIGVIENGHIVAKQIVSTGGKGHGELAGFLKQQGVDVCLCSGMGAGAYDTLRAQKIQVIRGVKGDAEVILNGFAKGLLQDDPGAVCNHHHDEENGHSCHCGKHS